MPMSNTERGRNFDPETVPIRPAATVMLVDDRPDLHVLMVRRTARVVFAPDMWVFPGGRVDPDDHLDDFDTLCSGISDTEASRMLEMDRGGLAWWMAACRETSSSWPTLTSPHAIARSCKPRQRRRPRHRSHPHGSQRCHTSPP